MQNSFLIASLATSFLLAACASTGSSAGAEKAQMQSSVDTIAPVADSETAVLSVARFGTTGYALKARILVDGEDVGRIKNNQYLMVPLTPGPHEIKLRFNKLSFQKGDEIQLDAKAGETYAYRITSSTSGFVGGTTYGNSVSTDFRLIPTTPRTAESCCELISASE